MKKIAAITIVSAITALSAALLAPTAFAGENHHGGRDNGCHSCSGDRDDNNDHHDRDNDGGLLGLDLGNDHHDRHNDGGLLGLDLGDVLDGLLDTVGNTL